MRRRLLIPTITILAAFVAGCAEAPAPPDQQGQSLTINLKGSDTMLQLGQRWSEVYMRDHPNVRIQVTGGGSGTGIAALINGTTEICQSSRPIKPEEKESVKANRNAETIEIPVAIDALAVYVNKQNKVDRLNMAQLKDIFQGKITNWKDVGGANANIILYGRENNSGTYVFFKEH